MRVILPDGPAREVVHMAQVQPQPGPVGVEPDARAATCAARRRARAG